MWPPDGPVAVHLSVLATEALHFVADARTYVSVSGLEGYELVATPQEDGTTVYTSRPAPWKHLHAAPPDPRAAAAEVLKDLPRRIAEALSWRRPGQKDRLH